MSLLWDFIITLLIIWPPYVANATPVIASKVFRRRTPIDLGRNFIDGRRLFGDGKTYEGFITGLLAGFVIGEFTYIMVTRAVNIASELPNSLAVFVMCIAALLGDLLGAFIKRRLGLPRGAPAPLLDQLDFLLAALLALWLVQPSALKVIYVVIAVLITPPIHLATNTIAYLLGLKREPW
ncbi:CDP-2,3-bis-(O-geranylgeranyl)-sn-glycerol synthase [Vulcanisaeta sp. JCM 16159]|uniref:CDP-2,3-bis-(O-geranylgeranyl)-sn-glycerol synthase n=1 Tax=Vulcanisaeta sp. JCM 16159 TaxID=1295371 RepID=UPI0006D0459D|nr:CDP-2,3-bis-(O-geranylgeranyl)-sn-glycerol synthase [Vulcanisaeta sp. JCM 16159]